MLSLLVDMNLTPRWVEFFRVEGYSADHWSTVGNPAAADAEIMIWAGTHGRIVFTHDMDFGTALALTRAPGPSVLQVRTERAKPETVGSLILQALRRYEAELATGALVVVDGSRHRVRILPL